ncbi:glycosyltransferase family 4 protein [Patescibacteria group bacterium]|nr:glycosyltransferase family 4 protein [Patescibacteria group bacterium]
MGYKILYVTPFPHIGGGETALLYLLEELKRKRRIPEVIVTSRGQLYSRLRKVNIKTHVIDLSGYSIRILFMPGFSLSGIWHFLKLAKKIQPSLIHINHPTLAIYAGIVGKILKIPVVATSHGIWDCIYFYQDLATRIFCNRILPITPEVQKCLTRRGIINKDKTKVIYLGVDANRFKPAKSNVAAKKRWNINSTDLVVTMVARFDFVKDPLTFLKVATKVIEQIPNVTFLIVGDVKLNLEVESDMAIQVKRQLDGYINRHPRLKPHVIFTSFQEDVQPVYHATDILFSSSLAETLPMSFLEGAACGLPIVSLKLDSRHRIVQEGKNGFLAPPGRKDVLLKYLLTLLKDQDLREKFGRYSRKYVLDNFTIERYVKEIEGIYQELFNERS